MLISRLSKLFLIMALVTSFAEAKQYFNQTVISSTTATQYLSGNLVVYENVDKTTSTFELRGGSVTKSGTYLGRNIATDGTKLDAVVLSTGTLATRVTNLETSTGTLKTSITNLETSTGTLKTSIDNLALSTGTLQSDLATEVSDRGIADAALGVSTGTLDSSKLDKSSATATYQQKLVQGVNYDIQVQTAVYALNGGSGSGSGDSLQKVYTQVAHGFTVGKAIYNNGSQWLMAQANAVGTADALGVVNDVGVDTFTITLQGYISGLSGLTGGSVYYLSDSSSGTLTTTEPTTYGYVSKPMLFALGTSSGIVVNMRGVVITQTGVYDGVPVGAITVWHSTSSIPNDFLYANGQAVSRTTYSTLFAQIGTKFGSGDGSTTFNVPDGRGMFLRGLDNGRGLDARGSNRVIGSTQTHALQGHRHNLGYYGRNTADESSQLVDGASPDSYNGVLTSRVLGAITDNPYGEVSVSTETVPVNLAVAFIIKYRTNISTASGILDTANTWTATQNINTITTSSFTATGGIDVVSGKVNAYNVSASSNIAINTGGKLFFDGGVNDYIFSHSANYQEWRINEQTMLYVSASELGTRNVKPQVAGTYNLGDATEYWNDISYKTLTDRGCLGWLDEGVELQDGSIVPDTEALLAIKKHASKLTIYGTPMLDYKTFPKIAYKKAEKDGVLLKRDTNDEPIGGQDGIEMTSMFSIMIGAIKELTIRVQALENENTLLNDRITILENNEVLK